MRYKEARKIAKKILNKDIDCLKYWYEKGYQEWDELSDEDKEEVNKQINNIINQFEKLIECHICGGKGFYEPEDSMLIDTRECVECK